MCLFLWWRTSYHWQATALKLSPTTYRVLGQELLFTYSRRGTNSQATPELFNVCVTGCDKFASNHSWTEFDYSFFYLVLKNILTEDTVVQPGVFGISAA